MNTSNAEGTRAGVSGRLDNSYERLRSGSSRGRERFSVSFVGSETVVGEARAERHRRLGLCTAASRA
jgi:hypothetical protein